MKGKRLLAWFLSTASFLFGILHFVHPKTPAGFVVWLPKLLAEALSPYLALAGLVGAVLGFLYQAPLAALAGLAGTAASARYVWRVVTSFGDFNRVFDSDWQDRIPPERARRMLQDRWTWNMARDPEPRWQRDVTFWTLGSSESARPLLCDIWQPLAGVAPSGLGIVYCHGSAWTLGDKDLGTRPFFRQLANQGHLVMDVAYRLYPETGMAGMVGDVKRAVAWLKANAGRYGLDPERIVLSGASAGGHLALLSAFAPDHPDLTPAELQGTDLSVRAVFSYYAPVDLWAIAEHNAGLIPPVSEQPVREPAGGPHPAPRSPEWLEAQLKASAHMSERVLEMVGGRPEEVPGRYDLFSPIMHVHPGCPPTLLIQGEHDLLVPAWATYELYQKLLVAGVPAVYLELPQTDHAFDLVCFYSSPPAQVALHELERFLALME